MPTKGKGRPAGKAGAKSAVRTKRRQKIAAGVVSGKPIAGIARETGVSRSWASREANSPQTKVLIAELLDEHRDRVRKLVGKALDVIDDAFTAKDGKDKDHRVRLLAAKRIIELATAGRKAAEPEGDAGVFTWESFKLFYQKVRKS